MPAWPSVVTVNESEATAVTLALSTSARLSVTLLTVTAAPLATNCD